MTGRGQNVVPVTMALLLHVIVFGSLIFAVCLLGTFYLLWLPFSEFWDAASRPGLLTSARPRS